MINNYEKIFNLVKRQLQELESPLESGVIEDFVKQIRLLIESDKSKQIIAFWGLSENIQLKPENWGRIIRELEMHFDVKMDNGFLIQGDDQKKRNTTWWTNNAKSNNELFYWNRYKELIGKKFAPEVIRTIDVDTDVIMNNISDPSVRSFSCYGMVVGHVQSGKTANYNALINKACDAGYKFIIVIAGGINNLRNQTQERVNEAIIGFQDGRSVGVGNLGGARNDNTPSSLTTAETDFNKRDADKSKGIINFDNVSVPVIMVIKKQTNTLSNVIEWLSAKYKKKISDHAMLMIDDESDYASVNTKGEENPSTINRKLRQLMGLFEKSAYVAYTATPYANIFIDYKVDNSDYGADLFPKDFIVALNAPDNYFGAKKIFLDKYKEHIVHIEDNETLLPLRHKKDFTIHGLPNSLEEAIRVFILNIAIRNLRGQRDKHNSMLIHVSRFTDIHIKIAFFVQEFVNKITNEIVSFGSLPKASAYSNDIKQLELAYECIHSKIEFSWQRILNEIISFIKSIIVREVHQKSKIPIEYSKNSNINVIAIGGASLSRGYTLEGLSVSYFLRTTKMYDTLMQMGRWFGYRVGYEDICRIYLTNTMGENFALIINATEELFDDFRRMAEAKKTPNDFGLSVTQHPGSALQVTANNKLRYTTDYYFNMNLDGSEKETTCLKKDPFIRDKNLQVMSNLITKLDKDDTFVRDKNSKKFIWKDVDREMVIEFLNNYEVYTASPVYITSLMPIDFIKKYAIDINTKWDIMLASGKKGGKYSIGNLDFTKEFRTMNDKGIYIEANQRHISTGLLERVLFTREESKGKNRKDLRAMMKKPLIVLHIIDIETEVEHFENMVAFGICFPGGIDSGRRIVRAKINRVYVDQILESMREDSESND